jgi:hypothetical protein
MPSKPTSLLSLALSISILPIALTQNPQCQPNSAGTTFNGTSGSETQLESTTLRLINASDANQGVAVDRTHIYSIDNFSITKHHKTNGTAIQQWKGDDPDDGGAIIHLDGGVVINGTLYAPHSNYPASPITSSIEMWNITNMQHIASHSFGIYRGSLTWIDQSPITGIWYGTFANYDRVQDGQSVPYGLTMNTQLVEFKSSTSDPDAVAPGYDGEYWSVTRSWIFPEELYQSFSPMSNSGGSFGLDGWLYITGHDASEVYVVGLPSAGSIAEWVATIAAEDIAGQGIAWDRSNGSVGETGLGTLYGISRESLQVVEMEAPLQECVYGVDGVGRLSVGRALPPGTFEYDED